MGQRRWILLLAVGALLAGLWWGLGVDDVDRPVGDRGVPRDGSPAEHESPEQEFETRDEAGSIRGTVLAGGEPVATVVELCSARPRPSPFTPASGTVVETRRSTSDGRFCFAGLEPGGYELRAAGPAGNEGRAFVFLRPPGQHESVVLRVPLGVCRFGGRILWADGRPFVGEVWAGDRKGPWKGATARTDAEGHFELRGVDVGFTPISAGIENRWFSYLGWLRLPTDQHPVFRIGENARELPGRVLDAATGRPVAGASVLVDPYECRWRAAGRSGEDGTFRVAVPTVGRGSLQVRAAGYAPIETSVSGRSGDLTLRLLRPATLVGRVLDAESREPVAGITVQAGPTHGDDPGDSARARSGPDGRYRLEGLAPRWRRLVASGLGYVSTGAGDRGTGAECPRIVDLSGGGEVETDLLVVPGAEVAGLVVDGEGRGVRGAVVEFTIVDPRAEGPSGPFEPSTVTDGNGRFRVAGLAPGLRYSGTAFAGLAHVTLDDFYLPAAGRDDLVVRLPELARYEAVVTDEETGRPVPGASVSFAAAGGKDPRYSARCGPDGRAVRYAPRGRAQVAQARHGLYRYPVGWVPLPENGPVRLVLRKGAAVAGRVRASEGVSAAGVWVTGRQAIDDSNRGRTYSRTCQTASDGAFRLEGFRPGRVSLDITFLRAGATVEAGAAVDAPVLDLDLPTSGVEDLEAGEKGSFEVMVLDPAGRPVPSAIVNALDGGRDRWHYDFANLGEGRTVLGLSREDFDAIEVHSMCDLAGRPLPYGAVLVSDIPADAKRVVVRAGPEKRISGRVLDEAGFGLRGVAVSATRFRGSASARHARAVTGEGGDFDLGGLDDGVYVLRVEAPAGTAAPRMPSARGGERDITIRLTTVRTIEVRVVDGDGRPVAGARLNLREERGRQIESAHSGAEGWAALTRVPTDRRLTLKVQPPDARAELTYWEREPWSLAETRVVLAQEFSVAGRVVDAAGAGVFGARVEATGAGARFLVAHTGGDGSFRIEGLLAGSVTLRATVEGERRMLASRWLDAAAGAEDVRLALPEAPFLKVRVPDFEGDPDDLHIRLFRSQGAERYDCMDAALDAGGRVVFRGLDPDTRYTLWITSWEDGRCFYREGLSPLAEEIVVRLTPGHSIRGRVIGPANPDPLRVVNVEVTRGNQYADDAEPDERGEFVASGLPAGTYRVIAFVEDADGRPWSAEGEVSTGGRVTLTMRPKAPDEDE